MCALLRPAVLYVADPLKFHFVGAGKPGRLGLGAGWVA